jgi:hypothetical protein
MLERDRALEQVAGARDLARAARALARRGFTEDSVEAVLARRPVADDPAAGVG